METVLDIGAVIIFLLVVPSVVWAVHTEGTEESSGLALLVALFVTIFGLVSMSAASELAAGPPSTQTLLLIFFVLVAILARTAWASKSVH